jgi:hypothetical protein
MREKLNAQVKSGQILRSDGPGREAFGRTIVGLSVAPEDLSAQHVWLGGIFDNFKPPSGYLRDSRNPKPVEILTVSQVRDAVFRF